MDARNFSEAEIILLPYKKYSPYLWSYLRLCIRNRIYGRIYCTYLRTRSKRVQ